MVWEDEESGDLFLMMPILAFVVLLLTGLGIWVVLHPAEWLFWIYMNLKVWLT